LWPTVFPGIKLDVENEMSSALGRRKKRKIIAILVSPRMCSIALEESGKLNLLILWTSSID
jgi:hypothetical protein